MYNKTNGINYYYYNVIYYFFFKDYQDKYYEPNLTQKPLNDDFEDDEILKYYQKRKTLQEIQN